MHAKSILSLKGGFALTDPNPEQTSKVWSGPISGITLSAVRAM